MSPPALQHSCKRKRGSPCVPLLLQQTPPTCISGSPRTLSYHTPTRKLKSSPATAGFTSAASASMPQVLYLSGANRPGLLTALSAALRDLGLEVSKAIVETDAQNNKIADKFFVTRREGGKVLQVRSAKCGKAGWDIASLLARGKHTELALSCCDWCCCPRLCLLVRMQSIVLMASA